jgi:hypothetical protein
MAMSVVVQGRHPVEPGDCIGFLAVSARQLLMIAQLWYRVR